MDTPPRSQRTSTDLQTFLMGFLRISDVAAVVISGILAYRARELNFDLPGGYQIAIALGVLLTLNYFHFAHLYRFANLAAPIQQAGRLTVTWIVVIVTLILVAYFTKTSEDYSRIWVALWFSFSFVGFLFLRFLAILLIRRWRNTGALTLNIVIV